MPITIAGGVAISGGVTFLGPQPPPTDPNFNQVSLLLHGDGTDGSQNNTFLDSSTNNFTITRNGNTTQGTNTPFSQEAGYWSYCIVNNNTTSIATPDSSSFILSADFTVEMWLNNPSTAGYIPQVFNIGRGSNSDTPYASNGIMLQFTGDGVYLNGSNLGINLQSYCNSGQWMHIALCRTGSTFKVFINGNQIYSSTFTAVVNSGGKNVLIGSNPALSSFGWTGYISNLRVVNGTGLYTSNFTPSTTPLTAVTNTVLLTGQSNYLKDNSSNNFAITAPTGTPSVQPFSPFAPTSAYSTGVNGGSMYFDGASDYLTTPGGSTFNLYTGDFTIEYWIYKTADKTCTHISYGEFIWRLQGNSNGTIDVVFGTSQITSNVAVPLNAWSHVALVRYGSTTTLYINGVSAGTSANPPLNSQQTTIWIGTNPAAIGTWDYAGYMSNVRIVKGTAVYTANFTPPAAPLTAITNTQLLLGGTNAGIFDNAAKNTLETVGTAQVSTSVVKYGTGSMKFNGTTDYLTIPSTPQLQFGTGDYTIEGWIYLNSVATTNKTLIGTGSGAASTNWQVSVDPSYPRFFYSANLVINGLSAPSLNTWTYLAATRSGTTVYFFVDGVLQGTATDSSNLTDLNAKIGLNRGSNSYLNGYIDDLRITKGIARYTTNFTPPTAAFLDQ